MTDAANETNAQVLAEYESFMRSWHASRQTVNARVSFIASRLRAWDVEGFTADTIRAWFADQELARWSRTTYYSHLNSFCEFLVAAGYSDANPMLEVRKPKAPRSEPRPLSASEVERVLTAATGRTRDWLVIAMLSGLRAHEIAKLRGEDVQPEGIFVNGKGGVEATLPCHPDLWEMAQRYPRSGYWFPGRDHGHLHSNTISSTVSKFFSELGIRGSIHRCRHVYGTTLLRNGVHIRKVQKLMRHSSLSTTALYTAVDEDELRAAIDLLPSLVLRGHRPTA